MEDIYQKVLNGNKNYIKGIYASSVASAYSSVLAAVEDEKKACEIVEEAYLCAFSTAKSYDEFFSVLNKRALKGCVFYTDNPEVKIDEIVAINTIYSSLEDMPIPEELKGFDSSLSAMVLASADRENYNIAKTFDKRKKKSDDNPDDLSEDDILEKETAEEFSVISDYEVEKRVSVVDNLNLKLKGTEKQSTGEEKAKEEKENEKNKKTLFISLIIAGIFLIGAIIGFVVARHNREVKKNEITTVIATDSPEVTQAGKTYKKSEQYIAYGDYLNKVLFKVYSKSATQRIIAYNETGKVGIEQLNGVAAAKIADIDDDGIDDLLVIILNVMDNQNKFTYSYSLGVYTFEKGKVVPLVENYRLLEYTVLNKGDGYALADFNMFIRLIENRGVKYLYAESVSPESTVCSYHYFENGEMHEAQRFVYLSFNESSYIYMQRKLDGTYLPLYCVYGNYPMKSIDELTQGYKDMLRTYEFNPAQSETTCAGSKQLINAYNKAFEKLGFKLGFSTDISANEKEKTDYIINLNSKIREGDMLSREAVISIKDYSDMKALAANKYKKPAPTTEKDITVIIPTTKPTTAKQTTTKKETTTKKQSATKKQAVTKKKTPTTKKQTTTKKATPTTKKAQPTSESDQP